MGNMGFSPSPLPGYVKHFCFCFMFLDLSECFVVSEWILHFMYFLEATPDFLNLQGKKKSQPKKASRRGRRCKVDLTEHGSEYQ
jgi:hypothetical protein